MSVDSSSLLSKYLGEQEGNSLKFMQRMLYLIFSEVVYQRELLPQEHFSEKIILGCKLHIPDKSRDRRQIALHNHLKNAAEAVTDKKLKQLHLMVHKDRNDPSAADEVFIMEVVYSEDNNEAAMQMSCGDIPDVRVCYGGVEELQKQTRDVFRCLRKGLSTLDRITRNVSFSFYIMYRDGVDRSFHPSGYGQAARMYALPESAEIGDMGMLHAKEHACLLKVKSMMLEDGFQLMQRNVATQRSDADSLTSTDPSQSSEEKLSSDMASSLNVFNSPDEWEDSTVGGAKKDQRSTAKDQRSAASARTIRFEQTPSILDRSMSEDLDAAEDDVDDMGVEPMEESVELGTAQLEDFPMPSQQQQQQLPGTREHETTLEKSFASTVSPVTKKLAGADKRRAEKEKEKSPTPANSSHASSVDAGSEASSEKPRPVRRTSSKKRRLSKVKEEESTESDTTLTEKREESAVPARKNKGASSGGKDADTEPSGDTVLTKATVQRRRSGRRKESIEKPPTVAADESMEMEEVAPTPKKQAQRRGGQAARRTIVPETPEDTDQSSSARSTGRRTRNAARGAAAAKSLQRDEEEEETTSQPKPRAQRGIKQPNDSVVPETTVDGEEDQEEEVTPPPKKRAHRAGKQPKVTVPPESSEESEDMEAQSSSAKSTGGRSRNAAVGLKSNDGTPKRIVSKDLEPVVEPRTPGEAPRRKPIYDMGSQE